MAKPIIYAIIGKSASGKNFLLNSFSEIDHNINSITGTTTRPRRSEHDDEYNFISCEEFLRKRDKKEFAEWTEFKGWYYGTEKQEIKENTINVGIFNVKGLKKISLSNDYFIIPILIKAPLAVRLYRSYKRENKIKLEYFRRVIADFIDFYNLQKFLNENFERVVILKYKSKKRG